MSEPRQHSTTAVPVPATSSPHRYKGSVGFTGTGVCTPVRGCAESVRWAMYKPHGNAPSQAGGTANRGQAPTTRAGGGQGCTDRISFPNTPMSVRYSGLFFFFFRPKSSYSSSSSLNSFRSLADSLSKKPPPLPSRGPATHSPSVRFLSLRGIVPPKDKPVVGGRGRRVKKTKGSTYTPR